MIFIIPFLVAFIAMMWYGHVRKDAVRCQRWAKLVVITMVYGIIAQYMIERCSP